MNIIVAASENNVIGNKGAMPWHLRADLQYFKSVTLGHAVIMGRKTFESIGRPLPGRRNIVVSTNCKYHFSPEVINSLKPGTTLEMYYDLDEVFEKVPSDCFVIGGAQIYNLLWNEADTIYLTRVHTVVEEYDATVPDIPQGYKCISRQDVPADENNDYDITFEVWKR